MSPLLGAARRSAERPNSTGTQPITSADDTPTRKDETKFDVFGGFVSVESPDVRFNLAQAAMSDHVERNFRHCSYLMRCHEPTTRAINALVVDRICLLRSSSTRSAGRDCLVLFS